MDTYELGPFRLDTHGGLLLRGSEPVVLGGRAVALLRALVEKPGALVSKDELVEAAWSGQARSQDDQQSRRADRGAASGAGAWRGALAGGDRWIETMPPPRLSLFIGPVVAGENDFVTAAPPELNAPRDAAPIRNGEAERRQITAPSCELLGVGAGAGGTGLEGLREAVGAFQQSSRPTWRGRVIVGMAATATLVIVCLVWWLWPASNFFSRARKPAVQATGSIMSATTTPTAATISAPLVAPRLSIVVLPVTNLSNDPDQQYFADGITENLTTTIWHRGSRICSSISSNSAFTYPGQTGRHQADRPRAGTRCAIVA